MAWVAVNKDGTENISEVYPTRNMFNFWESDVDTGNTNVDLIVLIPNGSIHKLIGCSLTWDDEPVELK